MLNVFSLVIFLRIKNWRSKFEPTTVGCFQSSASSPVSQNYRGRKKKSFATLSCAREQVKSVQAEPILAQSPLFSRMLMVHGSIQLKSGCFSARTLLKTSTVQVLQEPSGLNLIKDNLANFTWHKRGSGKILWVSENLFFLSCIIYASLV